MASASRSKGSKNFLQIRTNQDSDSYSFVEGGQINSPPQDFTKGTVILINIYHNDTVYIGSLHELKYLREYAGYPDAFRYYGHDWKTRKRTLEAGEKHSVKIAGKYEDVVVQEFSAAFRDAALGSTNLTLTGNNNDKLADCDD